MRINPDTVTAPVCQYIDPRTHRPPLGRKLLLLSPYGIACIGHWADWYVAWAPLPQVPDEIKERMG